MRGRDDSGLTCIKCGAHLTRDEVAVYKKLINRGAEQFECENCLAAFYHVDVSSIRERMEYFRSFGCTLFDKER